MAAVLAGSPIRVAAQNSHWEEKGAFTGEVSGSLLKDAGCRRSSSATASAASSSARRTNRSTARRSPPCATGCCRSSASAKPSRSANPARWSRSSAARCAALSRASAADQVAALAVAYEPVWAIGTGRTASPAQANEVHGFIRGLLSELFGATVAGRVRILYGGSVKPDNVDELMREPELDGVLVGGAALQAASFLRIVNFRA